MYKKDTKTQYQPVIWLVVDAEKKTFEKTVQKQSELDTVHMIPGLSKTMWPPEKRRLVLSSPKEVVYMMINNAFYIRTANLYTKQYQTKQNRTYNKQIVQGKQSRTK